jgi:hypothetical protein
MVDIGEFGMLDNPDWGKSVVYSAASPAGLAKEQADAKQAERDAWKSRIVVDDPHFHVYRGSQSRNRPLQTDLSRTILRDAPLKESLKYQRQRSPTKSGQTFESRSLPLNPTPISIFTSESYGGPPRQTFSRTHDRTPSSMAMAARTSNLTHSTS